MPWPNIRQSSAGLMASVIPSADQTQAATFLTGAGTPTREMMSRCEFQIRFQASKLSIDGKTAALRVAELRIFKSALQGQIAEWHSGCAGSGNLDLQNQMKTPKPRWWSRCCSMHRIAPANMEVRPQSPRRRGNSNRTMPQTWPTQKPKS